MMMRSCLWALLVGFLLLVQLSYSNQANVQPRTYTFMRDAKTAAPISYYDYIIIGGGTAGCPLAATLSRNSSVLLLERGGSPYGNPNITNLAAFGEALSDVSPSSPSQRFVSEDGVINARARVLGGGSCLNAGFYTRASPHFVSDAGWDGKLVNESYEWVERTVAFEPTMREWQSAVRDGLVEAGVVPYNGFTYDHINGTKVGGTIFDESGHRHTAADLLEYAYPDNIVVLLHASVHKILFRRKGTPRPRARGVIFRDSKGAKHMAYLRSGSKNEIIVSAGAIGSPQLLMLSGVGPRNHLVAYNISVVVDQPLVGQGMSDNPMNAVFIPSPRPVEVSLIQVVGITKFGSYIEAASGAGFGGGPRVNRWITPEASNDANSHNQAVFNGGFILEKVMGPVSTGHLELRSRNPNDNPSVTFNYFEDPSDLQRCVQGITMIQRVIESRAFALFKFDELPFQALLNLTLRAPLNLRPKHENTTTSIEQFCKDSVMTIWHYHGGCQVGRVVDHDYKVLGVDALRVIDGSTFNYSPGTNPQATVMMLGRYMGERILNDRLTNEESG